MELARARNETKSALETLEGTEVQLEVTKVRLEGGVIELGSTKTELDSERNARQGFKAELRITRGALVVSNRKFASVLSLTRRQLIFLLVLFFLLWFIWTWMQLSLAVAVNRPGSTHIVSRSERSLDGNE